MASHPAAATAAAASFRNSIHFSSPKPYALRTPPPDTAPALRSSHICLILPNGSASVLPRRSYRVLHSPFSTHRVSSALRPELKSTLDRIVSSHKVVLFMKGTKDFPQCGFSNTVVQILKSLNVPFETLDILQSEALRQGLKEYSSWPTFPQLYVDGEFFGGCDITVGTKYLRGDYTEAHAAAAHNEAS